jgi:hypothetical protein
MMKELDSLQQMLYLASRRGVGLHHRFRLRGGLSGFGKRILLRGETTTN